MRVHSTPLFVHVKLLHRTISCRCANLHVVTSRSLHFPSTERLGTSGVHPSSSFRPLDVYHAIRTAISRVQGVARGLPHHVIEIILCHDVHANLNLDVRVPSRAGFSRLTSAKLITLIASLAIISCSRSPPSRARFPTPANAPDPSVRQRNECVNAML